MAYRFPSTNQTNGESGRGSSSSSAKQRVSPQTKQRKVSMLLYAMEEEAEDTQLSTKISESDLKDYDKMIAKFDSFFHVRKNMIFEGARFNRRCQKQDESGRTDRNVPLPAEREW